MNNINVINDVPFSSIQVNKFEEDLSNLNCELRVLLNTEKSLNSNYLDFIKYLLDRV